MPLLSFPLSINCPELALLSPPFPLSGSVLGLRQLHQAVATRNQSPHLRTQLFNGQVCVFIFEPSPPDVQQNPLQITCFSAHLKVSPNKDLAPGELQERREKELGYKVTKPSAMTMNPKLHTANISVSKQVSRKNNDLVLLTALVQLQRPSGARHPART